MYQVIFSSVVLWCAILSYVFMQRILSINQWIAIVGTTIGLTFCALDGLTTSNIQTQSTLDNNNSGGVSFGTLMTVGGTFLYGMISLSVLGSSRAFLFIYTTSNKKEISYMKK